MSRFDAMNVSSSPVARPPAARLLIGLLFCVWCSTNLFAASGRLLVKNARLFTMAAAQRDPFTGYLLVGQDGTILAVGAGEPPPALTATQVVDAHGEWVIPGLVSAHSHLWQAAYRGIAANKTLEGWIDDLYTQRAIKASPEDFFWFCLLGSLDHLQHGITAAYDFNYSRTSWSSSANTLDEAQFRAEVGSGIRFIHGYEPGWMVADVTTAVAIDKAERRLGAFLNWTAAIPHASTFLGVMINGDTAFNQTYQQAVMEKALMDRFHLKNQSHYLEPPESETQRTERSRFRWFADSGLLSDQLIFGHFIHTDDSILRQSVAHGVAMTWNPLSNGRMASGVADIPKYLKAGMRVGMGIDGEASGDLADPFENMRAGLYAVRDLYGDATVLTPYQILWLHTMGSADVLGQQGKLGSLETGKFADFVMIDPARLGAPLEDPYANLVLVTGERDIDRVFVGGELKVEQGRMVHQNMAAIEKEVNRRAAATAR